MRYAHDSFVRPECELIAPQRQKVPFAVHWLQCTASEMPFALDRPRFASMAVMCPSPQPKSSTRLTLARLSLTAPFPTAATEGARI